jgi:hypothetical protein
LSRCRGAGSRCCTWPAVARSRVPRRPPVLSCTVRALRVRRRRGACRREAPPMFAWCTACKKSTWACPSRSPARSPLTVRTAATRRRLAYRKNVTTFEPVFATVRTSRDGPDLSNSSHAHSEKPLPSRGFSAVRLLRGSASPYPVRGACDHAGPAHELVVDGSGERRGRLGLGHSDHQAGVALRRAARLRPAGGPPRARRDGRCRGRSCAVQPAALLLP